MSDELTPLLSTQEASARDMYDPGEHSGEYDRGELMEEEDVVAISHANQESPSQRQARYGRLCNIIIREGTKQIGLYVKNHLPQSEELSSLLPKPHIQKIFLKLKRSRAILPHQYHKLYPEDGTSCNEQDIDLSLWVILARNLTVDRETIDWGKSPNDQDDLIQHHILRIRDVRNSLHHVASNELDEYQFYKMWNIVATALRRLGTSEADIYMYKNLNLDPEATKLCIYEIKQQAWADLCGHLQIEAGQKHVLMRLMVALVVLLVVMFGCVVIFIIMYTRNSPCANSMTTIQTDEAVLYYMSRYAWGAKPAKTGEMVPFHPPVDNLIVSHTAYVGSCSNHDDCCKKVRLTQDYNMNGEQDFGDIAYSYLIGGDGVVYEGRGHNYIPSTAYGWNRKSLSIGYIGSFDQLPPDRDAVVVGPYLIQWLVDKGVLSTNATILGLCQVRGHKFPRSPGIKLLQLMEKWHSKVPKSSWSWRDWNATLCEGYNATS